MKDIITDKTFDDIGVYVEPVSTDVPRYNFRDMLAYCESHNKLVSDLSETEKAQFLI